MARKRPWTEEELAKLQDLWQTLTPADIELSFGRNRNVIRMKAKELGLPKKPRTPPISIVLRGSPHACAIPSKCASGPLRWKSSYAGVGNSVTFCGSIDRQRRCHVTAVSPEGRVQPLPPLLHLADYGGRLDWRDDNGRLQLAVAILGWLRPDAGTVGQLLQPFLRRFGARLTGDLWELPGRDLETWLKTAARKPWSAVA